MTYKEYEVRDGIDEPVLKAYSYGSGVYGTNTKESDMDYIVVVDSDELVEYSVNTDIVDCKVYSESVFIDRIKKHKLDVLESIFQNENDEYLPYFELDLEKLRHEISSYSSNSYVKCKKKLKENEVNIGLKSLFHSIRIMLFGIQIAKYGKIVDYSEANHYKQQIFDIGNDWNTLHKVFKPIHNELKSQFKLLAPTKKERLENEL